MNAAKLGLKLESCRAESINWNYQGECLPLHLAVILQLVRVPR